MVRDFKPSDEVTALTSSPAERAIAHDSRVAHLIVLSGANVGQVYRLGDGQTLIGRDDEAAVQLMDAGISRRHAMVRLRSDERYELTDAGSRNGTFANNQRIDSARVLEHGDKIQVGTMTTLKFSYADDVEASYAQKMYDVALRDGLTGAFNRRYFDERLHSEFAFAARHQMTMALVLIDLDHFKRFNDRFGHPAGDQLLVEFTRLMEGVIRTEDVLARIGGEEFGMICRETDAQKAAILAERVRHAAAGHVYAVGEQGVSVTVSVGVAAAPDSSLPDATALVSAADRALYRAKDRGRNCVMTHRAAGRPRF